MRIRIKIKKKKIWQKIAFYNEPLNLSKNNSCIIVRNLNYFKIMNIVKSLKSMQKLADRYRQGGKQIGFIPTMGALHEGHLSLIRKSAKQNNLTVVSIFVNPVQFSPDEDYAKYPRSFKSDCRKAKIAGADIIFNPSADDMYPESFQTYITPGSINDCLEGAARPNHMRGAATVCIKLFNIVKPHRSYFGQKDAQQLAIIKQITADLNLDMKIVRCPIIRTKTGIAMSSRHSYLSKDDLKKAEVIYKSLRLARKLINSGQTRVHIIQSKMTELINSIPDVSIEYISFNRWDDLKKIKTIDGRVLISLVVVINKIRLLDNIIIKTGR